MRRRPTRRRPGALPPCPWGRPLPSIRPIARRRPRHQPRPEPSPRQPLGRRFRLPSVPRSPVTRAGGARRPAERAADPRRARARRSGGTAPLSLRRRPRPCRSLGRSVRRGVVRSPTLAKRFLVQRVLLGHDHADPLVEALRSRPARGVDVERHPSGTASAKLGERSEQQRPAEPAPPPGPPHGQVAHPTDASLVAGDGDADRFPPFRRQVPEARVEAVARLAPPHPRPERFRRAPQWSRIASSTTANAARSAADVAQGRTAIPAGQAGGAGGPSSAISIRQKRRTSAYPSRLSSARVTAFRPLIPIPTTTSGRSAWSTRRRAAHPSVVRTSLVPMPRPRCAGCT